MIIFVNLFNIYQTMKNTFTFLVAFTLITLFSGFEEQNTESFELATVQASIVVSENSEPIAFIDKKMIDSVQQMTDIDLSGLNIDNITNETELKTNLISMLGSFITMIVLFFLRRIFPDAMKFNKSKQRIN